MKCEECGAVHGPGNTNRLCPLAGNYSAALAESIEHRHSPGDLIRDRDGWKGKANALETDRDTWKARAEAADWDLTVPHKVVAEAYRSDLTQAKARIAQLEQERDEDGERWGKAAARAATAEAAMYKGAGLHLTEVRSLEARIAELERQMTARYDAFQAQQLRATAAETEARQLRERVDKALLRMADNQSRAGLVIAGAREILRG